MVQRLSNGAVPLELFDYATDEPVLCPNWRGKCLEWLDNHPGRRLPFGDWGDKTDVLYTMDAIVRNGGKWPW